MPDMGFVMHMVRQILMSLLPKLMANPSLMSAIVASGKGPGQPPFPSMGVPSPPPSRAPMPMGANLAAGPPMGGNPGPMMGGGGGGGGPFAGLNSMSIFGPPAQQPGRVAPAMGAPGYMPMSSSDAMKDMRLFELLRDPTVGLYRDQYLQQYIPRGPMPWGWSLPDYLKDHILYAIQRRVTTRGTYTPKEHEIVRLIGDPVEKMPHIFGPGSRFRPM